MRVSVSHIFTNTCHFFFFNPMPLVLKWYPMWFWFAFLCWLMILSRFSCACLVIHISLEKLKNKFLFSVFSMCDFFVVCFCLKRIKENILNRKLLPLCLGVVIKKSWLIMNLSTSCNVLHLILYLNLIKIYWYYFIFKLIFFKILNVNFVLL